MFGKFLRSLRQSKGLSQRNAGSASGLSRQRVVDVEKSLGPYSVGKLVKYSDGLGYDVELHFVDKGDKSKVFVYKAKVSK